MSAKAAMKSGDLNRLLKAAKAHGFVVEIMGGVVRLLPFAPGAVPTPAADEADSDWDKRLGIR